MPSTLPSAHREVKAEARADGESKAMAGRMAREEVLQTMVSDRSFRENGPSDGAPKLVPSLSFAISGLILLKLARPPGIEPGTLGLEGPSSETLKSGHI